MTETRRVRVAAHKVSEHHGDSGTHYVLQEKLVPEKYHGTYFVPAYRKILTSGDGLLEQFEAWIRLGYRKQSKPT